MAELTLWQMIERDLAEVGTKEALIITRLYRRAIGEEFAERCGNKIPKRPTKRNRIDTVRYSPWWRSLPDQQLEEAWMRLARR